MRIRKKKLYLPETFAIALTHSPSLQSIRLNLSAPLNLLESNGSSQNFTKLLHDQHTKANAK